MTPPLGSPLSKVAVQPFGHDRVRLLLSYRQNAEVTSTSSFLPPYRRIRLPSPVTSVGSHGKSEPDGSGCSSRSGTPEKPKDHLVSGAWWL